MSTLKRTWEDDDGHFTGGLDTYRAEKRPRVHDFKPLPFRTSPTSKYTSLYSQNHPSSRSPPSTLTPVESSDDDDGNSEDYDLMVPDTPAEAQPPHMTRENHGLSIKISSGSDPDMEMEDSEPSWQSTAKMSNHSMLSQMGPPQTINNTGRIPTPIYGHFNTNMMPPGLPPSSSSNISRTVLEAHPESDWRVRGRLPSPVYDEDEPMSPAMGEAIDQLKIHTPGHAPPSFFENQERGHSALFERRATVNGQRARGGAMSSGDSGRSSRLMMGFKPDCEKCQHRVPGHYAHIVRD